MIWLIATILPFLLAFAAWGIRTPRLLSMLMAAAPLPALGVATGWIPAENTVLEGWLLGAHFGLDGPRSVLLLLAAFLWAIAGLSAGRYLAGDGRCGRFGFFFLLTMSGNLGLIMAEDAAGFYAHFVVMTFAGYGLVVHRDTPEAMRAGRIYLVMAILGELFLIPAILLSVQGAGSIELDTIATALGEMDNRGTILLLALIGFGVKAGAVPLYFWLPLAHPVAPTPASAVLSGSMIKAGLIGWLHFSPLQADALPGWPTACILLGLVAAFGAVAVGLAQRDLKTILAYSSISQMGVMTLIFGLALGAGAESGTVVAVLALYALNHGLAKGALFLGTALHPKAEGARIGLLAGLTVAALAIAGAPFTGGARTKYAAKTMLDHAPQGWEGPLLTLLAASAFGTALLLGRFLWLSTRPLSQASKPPPSVGAFPWILLLAAVLTLPHWAAGLTAASIPAAPLSAGALAEAAWPILLAALVLATAAIASQRRWLRLHLPKIPPGDLIVPIEHFIRRTALAHWWRLGLIYPERGAINFEARVDRLLALDHSRSATDRAESWLVQWRVAGAGFILILLLLVIFL